MVSDDFFFVPFEGQYIIYRPLRHVAFVGNKALVDYIEKDLGGAPMERKPEIEEFLESIGFRDEASPAPPVPYVKSREEYKPTMAVFLMTSACNLRCTYCYANGGVGEIRSLDFEAVKEVIDHVSRNVEQRRADTFSISFHGGGEPTVNWKILTAAVDYAREKDPCCKISLTSNGVWSESQRDFILRHINDISLSLDGIQVIQDRQRPKTDGSGSWKDVMETIRRLESAGIPFGIRSTVTRDSIDFLPESAAFFCEETEAKGIQVDPSYTSTRGVYSDMDRETAHRFAEGFVDAFEIADENGVQFYYSGSRPWLITSTFCNAPIEALIVNPDRDIVTCFEIYDRRHPYASDFTIGNVSAQGVELDWQALTRFWEKEQSRRAGCTDCHCYWHCAGDCASRSRSAPVGRSLRCQVNRHITRELLAYFIAKGDGLWLGQREFRTIC